MSVKEEEAGHQDGPAWKTVAKCVTYDEANQKRLELAMEESVQVKVHWQGKTNHRYYAVKTRLDPAAVSSQTPPKKNNRKKR